MEVEIGIGIGWVTVTAFTLCPLTSKATREKSTMRCFLRDPNSKTYMQARQRRYRGGVVHDIATTNIDVIVTRN